VVIGTAHILAILVGLFHAALYTFIRGTASPRVVLLGAASILGAWAGDAVGGRLGLDPIRVGDFHVVAASIVAWVGIAFMSVVTVLGSPAPEEEESE
jgi:uncharacterized membrane protein YfcA